MRVLVTGVTGFLGGRIAAVLSEKHTVRGFVRTSWNEAPQNAETATGDVTDAASLQRAAQGCDAIVHAAALVKNWVKDRSQFDRVNVGGLKNVLEAAQKTNARLFYVSSFIALGPTDGTTFDESTPRAEGDPHNDYERTKWLADRLAREAATAGRPIVRVYPGIVYGPGALTNGNHMVQSLLQHAHGKLPGMLGPGDRRMSLAFVDDVAQGFARAIERARNGSAYILGGDNRTLTDVFRIFEQQTGIAPPKLRIPYWAAGLVGRAQRWRAELTGKEPELTDEVVRIYAREWAYSSNLAIRDLGYKVTSLEEGLTKTVIWLRATGRLPQ